MSIPGKTIQILNDDGVSMTVTADQAAAVEVERLSAKIREGRTVSSALLKVLMP